MKMNFWLQKILTAHLIFCLRCIPSLYNVTGHFRCYILLLCTKMLQKCTKTISVTKKLHKNCKISVLVKILPTYRFYF